MNDYLAMEPLIVARLNDQINNVIIKSTWGMPKIQETFDLPPAVMILLEDDRPGQIQLLEDGATQQVEQTWLCLVVVADAENEAGPLIAQVIQALNGWQPAGETFSACKRVKSTFVPDTSPNGVYYFPVAFSTSFISEPVNFSKFPNLKNNQGLFDESGCVAQTLPILQNPHKSLPRNHQIRSKKTTILLF